MGNYGNLSLFSVMSLSLYNSVLLAFCIIVSNVSRETLNLKCTFDYTYSAGEARRSEWCSLVSNLMSETYLEGL